MPKRSIYLQPPDDLYQRIRRDLEFLCNYWDRLLASNQSCDIRLPELLRANHIIRQLSPLPSNHGLRVNMSFTILDNSDRLEPNDIEINNTLPYIESHNGFQRSPCNGYNAARYNDLLRNYVRQMSENHAMIERELMRARVSSPFIERNRFAGCQSAFYNQRTATCNWNKFPVGSRACSARIPAELQERQFNSRERSNRQTCALFRHECCVADRTSKDGSLANRRSMRRKESFSGGFNDLPKTAYRHHFQDTPQTSSSSATVEKLQPNNNALQNYAGTALDRNDNATIKQRSSKEPMEACQSVSNTITDTAKISNSHVKPDDDVAINKSGPRSINCQGNVLQSAVEPSVVADQRQHGEGRERGSKRKLDDLEDRTVAIELDLGTNGRQDRPRATEMVKPRVKDTPTIFSLNGRTAKNRIRNGKIPMEGRPSSRRHVSSPKYASFLRIFRNKEEMDERLRGNSSSRRDGEEKSQRRRGFSTQSEYDNRANPRIERRMPTPRSTVHTTYNPIMHSSATDSILDPSGLTIQLLRLVVLLHAPALMPALNSLIAQQNHQMAVPMPSSFEASTDLLTQISRLLNEQQTISNFPFVSALATETNAGSSRTRSEMKEEDTSIATEKTVPVSKQEYISAETSDRIQRTKKQQNEKDGKWRLTSMLTNPGVRLDRNIFTTEDFQRFEKLLRSERKRPEDVQSLSTRSKNEIVMKEYFRDWLHRLLQQLNSVNNNLLPKDEETTHPKGSSRNISGTSLEEVKGQRSTDRLIPDESPDSSRDDRNTFTEHEDEDSDDQKSFTSATSTNSSRSLRLKQEDAIAASKKDEIRDENSQDLP